MPESATADDAERLFQEAVGQLKANRLAEVDDLLGRLAPRLGDSARLHRLRGLVALKRRDHAGARKELEAAARLAPDVAEHQFDLGELHRLAGSGEAAVRCYRLALAREPAAPAIRLALAGQLVATGQRREALQELKQAVDAAGSDANGLLAAAELYRQLGKTSNAIRAFERARQARPADAAIAARLRDLLTGQVRPWHFRMMNDAARNRAYDEAIRRAVGPNTHVLEIGTGSGLLSMMAARAGAARVTTCERVEVIAETATEIVKKNRMAERIEVVAKRSTKLVVGEDLPEPADLLISEVLSDQLLGEGVLKSTADARRRLLKPGARLIPREVGAVIRLVGGKFLLESCAVAKVDGFDLTPFNKFAPSAITLSMESGAIEDYSDDLEVFRFDLARDDHKPEERWLRLVARRSGFCAGVLQWLRLRLDDIAIFENRPTEQVAPSAWRQVFYPFTGPLHVREGDTISLWARHNLTSLSFTLDQP